jgi:ribosomal protein S12 methylthiotransferase
MKAYLVSLGCPKNTVDAEAALGFLRRAGCRIVEDPRDADVLIVNACSFLDAAWRETAEEVEALATIKIGHPSKRLVLMGCLPLHRDLGWWDSVPHVDYFLPAGSHSRLPEIVFGEADDLRKPAARPDGDFDRFAGFENRTRVTPRHLAYVKIAEGCDHTCTFCAIPVIRGRMKSRSVESIVREVNALRADGVKEISLIAQDITAYEDGVRRLADLVDAITRTGIEWIRTCYVHPAALTLDVARRLFEHPSVCRYLEVPVQHASNRILRRMGRRHTREQVDRVLADIRSEFPDVVVRSEVIVGYPGEEEEDFDQLMDLVENAGFSSLGVFVYSPEPGTAAASLDGRVSRPVAADRAAQITDMQCGLLVRGAILRPGVRNRWGSLSSGGKSSRG